MIYCRVKKWKKKCDENILSNWVTWWHGKCGKYLNDEVKMFVMGSNHMFRYNKWGIA